MALHQKIRWAYSTGESVIGPDHKSKSSENQSFPWATRQFTTNKL